MTRPLRVIVADDEVHMGNYLRQILPQLGHEVVAVCNNGRELVEHCASSSFDLVIADIKMPEMDGLDAVREICQLRSVPIILVSGYHDTELLARAEENHVMAYLIKPIKQANLEAAIAIALGRSEEFDALQRETADLRQALEDRKVIERAKGVLMKRANWDEPEAFRRMRSLAREKGRKLIDIAQMILITEEAITHPNEDQKGQSVPRGDS